MASVYQNRAVTLVSIDRKLAFLFGLWYTGLLNP